MAEFIGKLKTVNDRVAQLFKQFLIALGKRGLRRLQAFFKLLYGALKRAKIKIRMASMLK